MKGKQLFYQEEKVEAFRQGEDLIVLYTRPHMLRIPVTDRQAIDDEVIRMLKMRTVYDHKYFIQEEVGKIIGVSRQMINRRWQVYQNEGLIALLARQWEKSKMTPKLLDRLAEIVVEDPFLFTQQIKDRLQAEGVCGEIGNITIQEAIKQMDGRKVVMLMRRKSAKRIPEAFVETGYLIERLFRIIEDLLEKVQPDPGQPGVMQAEIEKLKRLFYRHMGHRVGPTERDCYRPRKKLQRDCRRKTGFLKQVLGWIGWQQRCPDCQGTEIHLHCRRSRRYIDKAGELIQGYSQVFRCLNPLCRTKYFTVPPKGVELYARVHRDVKKMVLRWIFHLRGSLSRVCDELAEHGVHISLTTVLRWVKKAGEECVQPLHLFNQEDWQQPLCIDEKWVKVRSKWHYVFTAVGTKVTDLLGIDLYYHKDKAAIKTFLLQLKSLGFRPKSITTDLLLGYEGVVREVFPDCRYYQCMLHARRDANRIVRQSLANKCDEQWKDKLIQSISTLFRSKRLRQAKKRYRRFMKLKEQAPEAVQPVFKMMEKYFPKFCQIVGHKGVPRTTNPVERAIGELEERYQLTKGFTSFYFAQFFIKAFQMYYRLRKIRFGPFRGRSRLQLKQNPIGQMDFTDYLTPTFV